MARLERKFVRQIYRNSGGFIPTWPLGKQVKLGDVIDLKFRRMIYLGTLLDPLVDININIEEDDSIDDSKWQSKNSVNITFKGKGDIPSEGSKLPIDKAGLTVEFTKKGGFLFQPSGMKINRIKNLITVRKEAKEKLFREMFSLRKVYIITQVAEVNSYALTISQSKNSKLEVAVEGKPSISVSDLANVSLGLDVKTENALDFNNIGTQGGSIFFKAEKLILKKEEKEKLFERKPNLKNIPEEYLPSFLENQIIESEGIEKLFDFTPTTLEDLDDFMGIE